MLGKTSLATVGLIVGGIISVIGTAAYFTDHPTLNLAGFFYGIPLLLGGLALKAAELEPVTFTQPTTEEILTLREKQATPIQNQLRKDVTRYRYGQKVHLEESLNLLGLSPTDEETPILKGLREIDINDNYALVLEFSSPSIPLDTWLQKQDKLSSFFGPNIKAEVNQPTEGKIDLVLITTPEV
ncbi:DUF2854 domain-containing protein [Okeania sp. SIO2B3]|uniref:DUF2854 domain-containing protein n=1 Tax=Okeania sp. SIO2B3 TaxID=2607784 RepID=UPI0013C1A2A0|nr:DUF2854 domain-containing protein [Okeania sp. SIO2B3]NET42938.1 DUF2854 domain-containing protein [Okeania sp. SIO2B3]